jgi:hypothetical protein
VPRERGPPALRRLTGFGGQISRLRRCHRGCSRCTRRRFPLPQWGSGSAHRRFRREPLRSVRVSGIWRQSSGPKWSDWSQAVPSQPGCRKGTQAVPRLEMRRTFRCWQLQLNSVVADHRKGTEKQDLHRQKGSHRQLSEVGNLPHQAQPVCPVRGEQRNHHSGISGKISIRRYQITVPPGGSCLSTSSAVTWLGVPVIVPPGQISRSSSG